MDDLTCNRMRAGFARVLVDMEIKESLPKIVKFVDETDRLEEQKLVYEWKPVICGQCKGYRHVQKECKVPVKPVWKHKKDVAKAKETVNEGIGIQQQEEGGLIQENTKPVDQAMNISTKMHKETVTYMRKVVQLVQGEDRKEMIRPIEKKRSIVLGESSGSDKGTKRTVMILLLPKNATTRERMDTGSEGGNH
ncbi:OLC1v1039127C1 [Oldenlandia corymbosa var. corymbosa]|uniref:OLC1v1039127C1 n=1 Tax=Oldenlandia corymbosa var. corymbosa TaxID=529605 RepID=A0AAV1D1F9_OLDCO|nr:OLC1v1039127C1 [Oldenlandia corymbosa var. corymbosa]